MTCESLNRSLRMIPFVRFHGANDGQLVHVLGDARKDLGNLNSRRIRRNRPEAAIPFHVPAIEMADSALQPDQDDRLRFGLRSCSTPKESTPTPARCGKAESH